MTNQQDQQPRSIFATSHDGAALEAAAKAMASTGSPDDFAALSEFLSSGEALARLDNLTNLSEKTLRLARIFTFLEQHPFPSVVDLCLKLLDSPDFLADDERKIFLLPALAAVRPMNEAALAVFRQTNAEGYYNLNALLLVKNGSPNALALFEEMIRDSVIDVSQRVDVLHAAVLPYRIELAVLQAMNNLLEADLPEEVRVGVIETIFDNRTGDWFGVRKFPPTPPAWESASDQALEFVLALAGKVKSRPLSDQLLEAVNHAVARIREILAARRT